MGLPGQPHQWELFAEAIDGVGVEQGSRPLLGAAHLRDDAAPDVVEHRRSAVAGHPAHDLGRLHQRVVGAQRL